MILKKCAGTLAPPLSASGMLPHNWKLAEITSLHKKGAKNGRIYRPAGADPGFFLGGGAPLRNGVTDWSPDVNRFL